MATVSSFTEVRNDVSKPEMCREEYQYETQTAQIASSNCLFPRVSLNQPNAFVSRTGVNGGGKTQTIIHRPDIYAQNKMESLRTRRSLGAIRVTHSGEFATRVSRR